MCSGVRDAGLGDDMDASFVLFKGMPANRETGKEKKIFVGLY